MKKKLFGAAALLLMATVGAFATAQNTRFTQVWYKSDASCLSGQATVCTTTGIPDCVVEVDPDATGSNFDAQIYNSSACNVAYRQ